MPDASQTTLLYESLRLAILNLDLAPGQRLTERGLEAEFNASRTPVRAALAKLEGEGLAQRLGRGWIVSPIDLDELEALAEFRETIESAVVRLALERATDAELRALEAQLREPKASEAPDDTRIGPDFHVELAKLSGNHFLLSAVEGIMTRLARTRWLEVRVTSGGEEAGNEHEDILRALIARDTGTATELALAHIRHTMQRVTDSLRTNRRGFTARGMSIVGERTPPQQPRR
ncbi:GntR family transcriptional regulator [Parafrigoribacterium soli]|uniref:GntR family transcriptional regulator n=1 Tax=Parafrigoribacterium soli TaxID=3144663 RepID=UPI0032EB2862